MAAGCLQALSRNDGTNLAPDATEELLDRLGVFIPHRLQMFFDYVDQEARIEGLTEVSREVMSGV